MSDFKKLLSFLKLWLILVLISLIIFITLITVSATVSHPNSSLLIGLFVPVAIFSIAIFVLYALILATCYTGSIHEILMIIGFFIPLLGLIGLIMKWRWAIDELNYRIYKCEKNTKNK